MRVSRADSRLSKQDSAFLQVSFSGRKMPSIYDAVAFVVPANATFNDTPPAKFFWATHHNPSYLSTGQGTVL